MGSSNHFGFPVARIIDGLLEDEKLVIANEYIIRPLRVGSTHCRLAASGNRNSTGRFPEMYPKRGPSQPDPQRPVAPSEVMRQVTEGSGRNASIKFRAIQSSYFLIGTNSLFKIFREIVCSPTSSKTKLRYKLRKLSRPGSFGLNARH